MKVRGHCHQNSQSKTHALFGRVPISAVFGRGRGKTQEWLGIFFAHTHNKEGRGHLSCKRPKELTWMAAQTWHPARRRLRKEGCCPRQAWGTHGRNRGESRQWGLDPLSFLSGQAVLFPSFYRHSNRDSERVILCPQ